MSVRSLEKRAVDSLVDQLLERIGEDARILGPGGALSVLDSRYVGGLKQLLAEAIPGVPSQLLSTIREDLIVVTRAVDEHSPLVFWGPSTMRLAKTHAKQADELREYGDRLNVTIEPSRFLESDLSDAHLVFNEGFFAQRSIKGWAKLGLYFARLTASMEELARRSGLKPSGVSHGRSDAHLVYATLEDRHGEEVDPPF